MALDKLLENEAHAEIERIRAEARGRAEQIVADARERAESLLHSRQRQLDTQRQAGLVRARSAADLELNASRLTASESGVTQVYQMVEDYLSSVTQAPEYSSILARLIQQGLEAVPDAEAIEVNPAEMDIARPLVGGVELRENRNIRGGVRVVARGGKSGVTNTLAGRLERVKAEMAPQISRMLAE